MRNKILCMKQVKQTSLLLLISLCSQLVTDAHSTHQVKTIVGSTANRMEVLDWGGTEQAIIFLTGL